MSDMIAATMPKTDQVTADSLIGGPRTIKITKVVIKQEAPQQKVTVFFEGDEGRPFKPCVTMGRVMMEVWESTESKTYVGKSLTLFRDPESIYGGVKVGGVRISHMSHIDGPKTVMITEARGRKRAWTVNPLMSDQRIAQEPSPEIVDAGNQAAMGGMVSYRAWLKTLTAEQKQDLESRHAGWLDAAKKADTPPTADNPDNIMMAG